ncbi:UDP-glucuronosyltransferase, partial [Thraustotheca clavata]
MTAKRITLVAIGTRGDVQPFCVLGRALADKGFNVAIATEKRLENLVVNEFRLPYRHVAGDCTGLLFEPEYQKDLAEGSIFTVLKLLKQWRRQYSFDELLASYVEALKDSDIIVAGSMSLSESYAIAEKVNATWIPFLLWPAYPTRELPIWMMSKLTFGFGCLNLWSYSFLFKQLWTAEGKFINPWRQNILGLPPIESPIGTMGLVYANEDIPVLIGCSKLFCGPKRVVPPEYTPNKVHLLGPAFASPSPLSEKLTSFIDSAKADSWPITYIGFGSMPSEKPLDLLQMALDVCTLASCRAIVVAGWSELSSDDAIALLDANAETLIVVPSVSQVVLFPKVDCIVHHC